jgi:hypothetical protein
LLQPKVCLKIKAYFDKEETGMQLYPRQFINEILNGIPKWDTPGGR